MTRVWSAWISALAVLLATCASACAGPQRGAELRPLVGRTTRDYVDETRIRWTGSGPRPLSVIVWYPAAIGSVESDWLLGPPTDPLFRLGRSAVDAPVAPLGPKHPLVLLSHGTGGSAAMLAWLGEALARAGYMVAGINHHGNTATEDLPTPEGFMLWWERAVDLSRVLDRVLDDSKFGPLIDHSRIGGFLVRWLLRRRGGRGAGQPATVEGVLRKCRTRFDVSAAAGVSERARRVREDPKSPRRSRIARPPRRLVP